MKSPKAPDPGATASAQAAANRDTAITQQLLNMVNQNTPYGNLSYSHTGEATITGENGQTYKVPTFTSSTTLSPTQQQILQQNEQADIGMNNIALGQINRIGSHLSTPFNYDPTAHQAWASDLYGKLNDDTNAKSRAAMETRLANQGIQVGSTAYDDAMRNVDYSQQKARNDFMLGSYDQGFNTELTKRNQPINEVTALMSGAQVTQPTFTNTPSAGVNGTDVAGLINSNFANQSGAYQAKLGGLFGLGSAALGGWAMSDKRLKTDIKKVGETPIKGVNAYTFKYKGSPFMQIGAMAQEVERKVPDAVATTPSGFKAVNYERLAEAMGA